MLERCRREQQFDREQDSNPIQRWDLSHQARHVARQALGFFIGNDPVLPFPPSAATTPAAATATGPP
jgi:hypothetical protein